MIVRANFAALKQSRWYEYFLRFGLGGSATVFAGVIADAYGPAIGGFFLAFPAVFFASATLIEKHERERKEEKGLRGQRRGREAAALDAVGAGLGSIGLAAFATVVWISAAYSAWGSLTLASATWLAISVSLWGFRRLQKPA